MDFPFETLQSFVRLRLLACIIVLHPDHILTQNQKNEMSWSDYCCTALDYFDNQHRRLHYSRFLNFINVHYCNEKLA